MKRIETFTSKQYSHLRDSAIAVVDYTLGGFGALGYDWIDDCEKNDIVSDAVLKALSTFKNDGGCSFSGWLKMIARQLTISRLNGHREMSDIVFTGEEDDDLIEIPELATVESAEDVVIGWETQKQVEEALSARSETDGIIVGLCRQGYQPREIAERVGLSPNAASVRLNRTRTAIRYAIAQ